MELQQQAGCAGQKGMLERTAAAPTSSDLAAGTFRHRLGAQSCRYPRARGTRSQTKGTFGTILLLAPECRLSYRNQRLFLKNSSFALAICFFHLIFKKPSYSRKPSLGMSTRAAALPVPLVSTPGWRLSLAQGVPVGQHSEAPSQRMGFPSVYSSHVVPVLLEEAAAGVPARGESSLCPSTRPCRAAGAGGAAAAGSPLGATAKVTALNFIIDVVHLLFAAGAVLRLTEDSVALCIEQVFAQAKEGPKQPVL